MRIGNIRFSSRDYAGSVELITSVIESGTKCHQAIFANAFSIVLAKTNPVFASACKKADVIFADGMPVVWLSRLFGGKVKERIAGPDFMWAFSAVCAEMNYRVYLMGGTNESLEKIKKNMHRSFPSIKIVGTFSPPFGEWSSEVDHEILRGINTASPDVLWVGVSSPKQDVWIAKYKSQINAKVAIGVGAAFDFHAGTIRRAPLWMRRSGIEWFYRLTQDPKRLWRRYLLGNLQFQQIAFNELLRRLRLIVEFKRRRR